VGRFVLIGVTSSLIALEVLKTDALSAEMDEWKRLRAEHMTALREIFARVQANERIILFCHDPTALPFLAKSNLCAIKSGKLNEPSSVICTRR